MTRYYFHFASKAGQIDDHRGVELEGPYAAHRHALHLIRRTALAVLGEPWQGWVIEITDEHGQSVLTVPFHPNIAIRGVFGKRSYRDFPAEKESQPSDEFPRLRKGDW